MPLNSEKCCAEPLHGFTSWCVSPKRSNVIAGEPHLGKGLVALRDTIQNFAPVSVESGAHSINVLTKCFPSSHLGTKRSPKNKIRRQQFSRRLEIARIPDSFVKFSYEIKRTSQLYFRHCRHSSEPPFLCTAGSGSQHFEWGVIRMEFPGREHVPRERFHKGPRRVVRAPRPLRQIDTRQML